MFTSRNQRRPMVVYESPLWLIYTLLIGIALCVALIFLTLQKLEERKLISAVRAGGKSEALFNLSDYYYTHGFFRRGEQSFSELASEPPNNPRFLIEAQYFADRVDYRTGLLREPTYAKQALDQTSTDGEIYTDLVSIFLRHNDLEHANESAEHAQRLSPTSGKVQYAVANLYKRTGEFQKARYLYESCEAQSDVFYAARCAEELVPATRQLTVTLFSDRAQLTGQVRLIQPLETVSNTWRYKNLNSIAGELAWVNTGFKEYHNRYSFLLANLENGVMNDGSIRINDTIVYNDLLNGFDGSGYDTRLVMDNLPLSAYTNPTTLTIEAKDMSISTLFPSYNYIGNNSERVRIDSIDPMFYKGGNPISFYISNNSLNRRTFLITTNLLWYFFVYHFFYALSTVWGLVLFARVRHQAKQKPLNSSASKWERFVDPASPYMWIFDAALFISGAFTILIPLYLSFNHNLLSVNTMSYQACLFVLGVLLLRIMLTSKEQDKSVDLPVNIAAIIFICYLIPRVSFINTIFGFVFIIIGAVFYYTLIIYFKNWINTCDWQKLEILFSNKRMDIMQQIKRVHYGDNVINLRQDLEQSLAKGILKAQEYRDSLAIIEEKERKVSLDRNSIQEQIGIRKDIPLQILIYRLGPGSRPLFNALYGLAFGLVPFTLFLYLAVTQGEIKSYGNMLNWLFLTIGAPWGPIFLFFFGYIFRLIYGNFGVVKGLTFGGVLIITYIGSTLVWQFNVPNPLHVWGAVMRILITFVFTGAMMDWASSGFSWPEIRHSYNSPALTTVLAVIGATFTTVLSGVLTGTLSQMLSIVIQTSATAFGLGDPGQPFQ